MLTSNERGNSDQLPPRHHSHSRNQLGMMRSFSPVFNPRGESPRENEYRPPQTTGVRSFDLRNESKSGGTPAGKDGHFGSLSSSLQYDALDSSTYPSSSSMPSTLDGQRCRRLRPPSPITVQQDSRWSLQQLRSGRDTGVDRARGSGSGGRDNTAASARKTSVHRLQDSRWSLQKLQADRPRRTAGFLPHAREDVHTPTDGVRDDWATATDPFVPSPSDMNSSRALRPSSQDPMWSLRQLHSPEARRAQREKRAVYDDAPGGKDSLSGSEDRRRGRLGRHDSRRPSARQQDPRWSLQSLQLKYGGGGGRGGGGGGGNEASCRGRASGGDTIGGPRQGLSKVPPPFFGVAPQREVSRVGQQDPRWSLLQLGL